MCLVFSLYKQEVGLDCRFTITILDLLSSSFLVFALPGNVVVTGLILSTRAGVRARREQKQTIK